MADKIIIGVCGFQGSGKDTVADYLQNAHGFKRISFAGALKDAVSAIFSWDRELLEGRTKASREWREQVDPWWAQKLNMPNLTPRWVLQYMGTEVLRKGFHDNIWINSVEHKLMNSTDNIVISDVRFPNEIKSIKDAGGIVIRTHRGPDPEWYRSAEIVNQGPTENLSWASNKSILDSFKIHASEIAWIGTDFDAVLNNDGSIDDLYAQVSDLLQGHRASKGFVFS
jgi:hypothetical protein